MEVIGDEAEVIGKNDLDDVRTKTKLEPNFNFTVLLESRTEIIYLGSGVLVSNRGHYWVITAGHCVGTMESGQVTKMQAIRVRCPLLPNYNDDIFAHGRDKKSDHRFKNYIVNEESIFIYPLYVDDQNSRSGTDIGILQNYLSLFSNFF